MSVDASVYRKYFCSPEEMPEENSPMLVEHFVPPGITFIGGPSGHGKSWIALSLAKSLYLGKPFLNHFAVTRSFPIIYLVPEVSAVMIKRRLRLLGIGDIKDGFLLQTMSSHPQLPLNHPHLLDAVRDLKPIIFLDTAARFNRSADENAAMDTAQGFAKDVFSLLHNGAEAVIPLHHSIKSLAAGIMEPTLENILRGSGDFGGMADSVHGVLCSDKKNFTAEITTVKARDYDHPESFEIQGRPWINETGDLKLLRAPELDKEDFNAQQANRVEAMITVNPRVSLKEVADTLGMPKPRVKLLASTLNWLPPTVQTRNWHKK